MVNYQKRNAVKVLKVKVLVLDLDWFYCCCCILTLQMCSVELLLSSLYAVGSLILFFKNPCMSGASLPYENHVSLRREKNIYKIYINLSQARFRLCDLWGKFVIGDIGQYKINWIELTSDFQADRKLLNSSVNLRSEKSFPPDD